MEDCDRGGSLDAPARIRRLPLFHMKPQKVRAYWQCIRVVAQIEFQSVAQDDFVPVDMADHLLCLKCNEKLKYVPGGSHAADHMRSKHRDLLDSYTPPSPKKKSKSKTRKPSEGSQSRRDLTRAERALIKKIVAKWIARRMRPMTLVDDPELHELCEVFNDLGGINIRLPGRTEVREDIILAARELRHELRQFLASKCDFYSLTSDIWSDKATRSYISLTIHFVDEAFELHSKLLGVVHFPGKHDGKRIAAKLKKLIEQWNLDQDKCTMLVRDGASNAVKAAKNIGVKHMSCIAHSLQLVLASALMRVQKPRSQVAPPQNLDSNVSSPPRSSSENVRMTPRRRRKNNKTTPGRVEVAQVDSAAVDDSIVPASNDDSIQLDSESDADDIVNEDGESPVLAQLREEVRGQVELDIQSLRASTDSKVALAKVRAVVGKFRRIATYFKRSPKARHRFDRIQAPNIPKALILDCPTRWSSTHAILTRFKDVREELKKFFVYLGSPEGKVEFSDAQQLEAPMEEDYFYIYCMEKLLEPFARVTERLGGERYPTFNYAFPYLRKIKGYLSRTDLFVAQHIAVMREAFADRALKQMQAVREGLLELFTSRFRGVNEELMWVPLLDARFASMRYLHSYEREPAKELLIKAMIEHEKKRSPPRAVSPERRELFFSPPRKQPSVIDEFDDDLFGLDDNPISYVSQVNHGLLIEQACRAEADSYLTAAQQVITLKLPAEWWPENVYRYPIMSKLARKWLACPAASVASERAFSTGGNVVTVKRASLKPSMVEDLVLLAHHA